MTEEKTDIPGVGMLEKPKYKYAGFNLRMLAATIDSLIIMVFLAPLIDKALNAMYGPISVDVPNLMLQLSSENDPQRLIELFNVNIIQSGLLQRWVDNTFWQTVVLMAATGACWFYWASSPGKMIFRMKIVDEKTFEPISIKQILIRLAGYIVSGVPLFFGYFWIGFNKRRRGWHDFMAGTVVIVTPKPKAK